MIADAKMKVLDVVKHKSIGDCTVEVSGDGSKGNAELKIYKPNPDKKKGATLELRKKPGFDNDVVKKLKTMITIIVDGFIAGDEIEDILTKSNKNYKSKISKVTSKCKMFSCDMCNFETKYVAAFKTHKTKIHMLVKCELWDCKFKTQNELEKHLQNKHTKGAHIECINCDSVIKEKSELDKHRKLSHGNEAGSQASDERNRILYYPWSASQRR